MKLLVTGADGFIGRNLRVAIAERGGWTVLPVTRATSHADLGSMACEADAVVHLAGVNRPSDPADFAGNPGATQVLANALSASGRRVPVLFASSIQAELDNPYGRSKREAEALLADYSRDANSPVAILRLPNVFGKWCRPNYNSAVATFCHRIARGQPIEVHDVSAVVQLVYIDDLIAQILRWVETPSSGVTRPALDCTYHATVGQLADQIRAFDDVRNSLITQRVGTGLVRALYATYMSYLPTEKFSYALARHGDARGVFVEMLKTPDSGQFSYFTAHPGVTRGGHYHHTKTEKFLVIKGNAIFRFRDLDTGERYEIETCGENPVVVDTIPGWSHDIKNVGSEEMVVMLWANENFDRARPDTVAAAVQ